MDTVTSVLTKVNAWRVDERGEYGRADWCGHGAWPACTLRRPARPARCSGAALNAFSTRPASQRVLHAVFCIPRGIAQSAVIAIGPKLCGDTRGLRPAEARLPACLSPHLKANSNDLFCSQLGCAQTFRSVLAFYLNIQALLAYYIPNPPLHSTGRQSDCSDDDLLATTMLVIPSQRRASECSAIRPATMAVPRYLLVMVTHSALHG